MAVSFDQVSSQLKQLNTRLTTAQKASLILSFLLVTGTIIAAIYFVGRPDWQVLFAGLNAEDAGSIVAKLKELKVDYNVGDNGSTIFVPAEKVNELRIQLASEGIPQNGRVGFELFDRNSFGATDFTEQINYRRALEGELTRTIKSISEIHQARVHLVIPKKSLFESQENKAKASVTLKLKPGRSLSESQVLGIVHLVASSVEGLNPDNVSVVDEHGRMLSRAGAGSDEAHLTASQLSLRQNLEKDLSNRIINLLEPIVGAGKVRANCIADLDFSRSERTEEKYDPQSAVIRQQSITEERQGDGLTISGIPGVRSAQPNTQAQPDKEPQPSPDQPAGTSKRTEVIPADGMYKRQDTANYEISRSITRTIAAVGDIRRLSVSVVVDNNVKSEAGPDGAQKSVSVARSESEMESIRQLVSATVGFNEQRGDRIVVQNIPFGESLEEPSPAAPANFYTKNEAMIKTALKFGVPILLVFLVYFMVLRPAQKHIFPAKPKSAPAEQPLQLQARTEGADQPRLEGASEGEAKLLGAGEQPTALLGASPKTVQELEAELASDVSSDLANSVTKMDILKKRISEQVKKQPELAVKALRAWLAEEGANVRH